VSFVSGYVAPNLILKKRYTLEPEKLVRQADYFYVCMYDNYGNFNNTCRYTLAADSQAVKERLVKHLPAKIRQHNQFSIEVEEGYFVTTRPHVQINLVKEKALSLMKSP
jgi:hypothetical protein